MGVADLKYVPGRAPEGFVAAPISAAQAGAPVRVCVLVRAREEGAGAAGDAGRLVLLRDQIESRVYLGCLADAAGQVREWVEVWVQSVAGLAETPAAYREALTNAKVDERWRAQVRAFERMDRGGRPLLVRTGWEGVESGEQGASRPLPILLDAEHGCAVHPRDRESGDQWRLCEDDGVLEKAGLPRYSTSLHRYLYLPELGAEGPFVPVTPGAPTSGTTRPIETLTEGAAGLVPLNVEGGYVLVRACATTGLEAFIDVLGGAAWPGVPHGRTTLDLELTQRSTGSPAPGTGGDDLGVFLGRHGKWGRLVEAFHLKLRVLADVVAAVRGAVEATRRPLLNLDPESFRVRLGEWAPGLPFLWTARVTLVRPGSAVALPVGAGDAEYYLPAESGAMSIYRPAVHSGATRGRASVRIREVLSERGEDVVLEGTLTTAERLELGRSDLVWVRLNVGGEPLDLYATLESKEAMAAGEWRMRTLPRKCTPAEAAALKEAAGVPLPEAPFEVIPLLSTPCDLYSLGVLAVRTLVSGPGTALAVALDEVLSLARQAAADAGADVPLEARIRTLFERDPRWILALGPQRLTSEPIEPGEALDLIPPELWWETLAMIVRMFPGMGPDSTCADYGDARPEGLHVVFDRAAADLDRLLRRSRSLIVIDWKFNREIHSVVRKYLTGLDGAVKGARAGR